MLSGTAATIANKKVSTNSSSSIKNHRFIKCLLNFLLLFWPPNLSLGAADGNSDVGCSRYGRPLCCEGRNANCKSRDSAQQPLRPIYRFSIPASKELAEVFCQGRPERIGFAGILPGFVALEGAAGKRILGGGKELLPDQREHFRLIEGARASEEAWQLEFGWPWEQWAGDFLQEDEKNWPLVRYSLLNRHLPLRIVHQRPSPHQQGRQLISGGTAQQWRSFLLAEAGPIDCYCDQFCVKFGDCCANYMDQCPAVDCQVGNWSGWSACMPDGQAQCGVGIRTRRRRVLRPRKNAGAECPENLEQQIGCFQQCRAGQMPMEEGQAQAGGKLYTPPDVTTVALLLDYRFNRSRQLLPALFKKAGRKSRREAAPEEGEGIHLKYCVHYRIEWLNRNCVEPEWRPKLREGRRICAECQPEAQFHRPRPRCASDLEDGQSGFWKLIGPKSCYGIWRRLHANNTDCDCARQFPQLNPFLLV